MLAAVEIGGNAQPVQNEQWATLALERNRVAFVKDSATNELPFIKRDQSASGVALTYGEMTDSTANVVIFLIKNDTSMAPMVIHNLISNGVKVGEYWNCSPE
jgi:hypothetical protein